MNKYAKVAKCPFYLDENADKIACEGVITRSTLLVRFSDPFEKDEYCKKYCRKITGWKECPVAVGLAGKYI